MPGSFRNIFHTLRTGENMSIWNAKHDILHGESYRMYTLYVMTIAYIYIYIHIHTHMYLRMYIYNACVYVYVYYR